jgi:acylglycerol lipase
MDNPSAVVLFVHGSGEHCQRYRHVAQFFNKHRISCVAYDLRGHGLSGGERGFSPHIDALLDDLQCVIKHIRDPDGLHLSMPIVIYAHGTGWVVCLTYIMRRPDRPLDCQAFILSTPSVCLKVRPTAVMLFVSRAFANLSPHFRLPVAGNYTNEYTNDPDIVKQYRNDPLVHDRWPARTLSLYLEVGYLLETAIVNFSVPVLIQHGVNDTITPIEVIRTWANTRVKAVDKTFKEWTDHFHELHNDLGKQDVFDHVLDWIQERLKIAKN